MVENSTASIFSTANSEQRCSTNCSDVTERIFCQEGIIHFQNSFRSVFGYISLIICLFGLTNNVINTIILSKKKMRSTTNIILTGLAIADLLVMTEYIPYACHDYIMYNRGEPSKHTYSWAVFVMFHAHFGQIFHTISIWLTVSLAVWRLIYVKFPTKKLIWCTQRKALFTVLCAYICGPILCIPIYMSLRIKIVTTKSGSTLYVVNGISDDLVMKKFIFWTYGIFVKLIPCFLLTALMVCLIETICDMNRRRKAMCESSALESASVNTCANFVTCRKKDRTTLMLLSILLLFLLTEFPQGILSLMTALFGQRFYMECIRHLDEVLDLCALFNSSVNFILYCGMSSQFRNEFQKLYRFGTNSGRSPSNWAGERSTRNAVTAFM